MLARGMVRSLRYKAFEEYMIDDTGNNAHLTTKFHALETNSQLK